MTIDAITLPAGSEVVLLEEGGFTVFAAEGAEVIELTEERVTASVATADQRIIEKASRHRWVSEWEVEE